MPYQASELVASPPGEFPPLDLGTNTSYFVVARCRRLGLRGEVRLDTPQPSTLYKRAPGELLTGPARWVAPVSPFCFTFCGSSLAALARASWGDFAVPQSSLHDSEPRPLGVAHSPRSRAGPLLPACSVMCGVFSATARCAHEHRFDHSDIHEFSLSVFMGHRGSKVHNSRGSPVARPCTPKFKQPSFWIPK